MDCVKIAWLSIIAIILKVLGVVIIIFSSLNTIGEVVVGLGIFAFVVIFIVVILCTFKSGKDKKSQMQRY